ncbi:hypothetical protein [Nonomuraea dietziae]|uniref:hypothetical protein n=1 Tax=Nonomuraea dietziae TaxID=65515 RepID=UPI0034227A68
MRINNKHRRTELISEIRELADFLETHPSLPTPYGLDALALPAHGEGYEAQRAEIDRLTESLDAEIRESNGHYTARIEFGRVTYRLVAISDEAMARHDALMSYSGSISPDHPTDADEGVIDDMEIPIPDTYGGACRCGALTAKGSRLCRKCASRGRWNRRKAPYSVEGGDQW